MLPHPSDPWLREPYVTSANIYVELAERANGPIPKPLEFSYVWGSALEELSRVQPDARIINLETSVTRSADCVPKGINYRMSPENIPCIAAAGIDCCVLANNHVLDWGQAGLAETLETLGAANIKAAGAGRDIAEASAPAIIEIAGKGRVVVFSFGTKDSGIEWQDAATANRPGVNLLNDLSDRVGAGIATQVRKVKQPNDIVVASIHWGSNWGYEIPRAQVEFGRKLVDAAGVDIVHGHSSHHVKAFEVYKGRPLFYGCGDFLTDYEGIGGHEEFRDDLVLMYFVGIEPTSGKLSQLTLIPLLIKNFRLNRASKRETLWLRDTLNREGRVFGTRVELNEEGTLVLAN